MPLYEYRCAAGHCNEHYEPSYAQAPAVRDCRQCYGLALRQLSRVNVLNYFSQANGRVIQNLDRTRVIHSHAEHQQLMREKGVEPATQWHTSDLKRTDGLTPGNIYPVPKAVS